MNLRTKIMMIALLPVFILGIGTFILASDRTANGIYDEAYAGMQAASLAVRDIFEVSNHGSYHLDENGDLWKGETLNITQAVEIVDNIKDNTGMDVTIFWNDTRILTSITNASGERQVNTKASDAVIQKVLQGGEYYFDRNVEILGTEYVVCYAPFYQEGTQQPVGMVFLGKPRASVSKIIQEIRLQMLFAIASVLLITGIIVTILVNRIVNAMGKSMGLLQQISDGDLTVTAAPSLLDRSDEVGMLGREILQMRNKLQLIVDVLREKSMQLDLTSKVLKDHSGSILHLMKGLDQSAQEMSVSCSSQADDAGRAGSGVTQMGEMIGTSSMEIRKMHDISNEIRDMSEQTMEEMLELNEDMKNVRTSMNYLEQQTILTKESADKISHATDLIAAVASQTSLLSLNASIEAARAGEFGQGFGVVASEIQKLSIQANSAVEDIRAMVESLTVNSDNTIGRMEQVQAVIHSQEKNIEKTGQVFEQVRNGILKSVSHMDTVIAKTENMEDVRTDMVAAVQNSAAMAQENAASIQEVMASLASAYEEIRILSEKTDELGDLSLQMKESIGVFSVQETSVQAG